MIPARFYIKQALPRRWQVLARQQIARRQRARVGDVWPVHPASASSPEGWQGWPQGKQFAFVVTHDVDTARGLARCRELANIERERGLQPAFYFVPEGRYTLEDDLRAELVEGGAEIGVHGLYHDWRTFMSRRVFEQRRPRIKRYLRKWRACGFRAPSTIRNLDWIGELGVTYDASTFDTDPFEPQSRGAATIFPHWVRSRTSGGRYVELPYTLVQDFTLFIMLGEKNTDVWKRKLDWIAEQGGMALFIVHPDYISFNGDGAQEEYRLSAYLDFLDYVQSTYGNQYWPARPREVADYFSRAHPDNEPRSHQRICMMAYAFYETDNRIIRYAETLAARGDTVDVISLRRPGQSRAEFLRGVRVHRIMQRTRNEGHRWTYLARLLGFFVRSSAALSWRTLRERYDLVHVHSVPDFEVFAAWLAKALGSKVILDIHDIVPEFYLSKFSGQPDSLFYRLLLLLERWSCRFAHHVIISNHLWRDVLTARSISTDRCTVVLNYVVKANGSCAAVANPSRNGKFLVVYPGGLQWHQGLDLAIEAFAIARQRIPHAEFHIYGEGSEKPRLIELVEALQLAPSVQFHETVPFNQVLGVIAQADLGVVPKRADSFGNEAYSTKILEYMSQGVPVLVSSTKIDRYYFDDQTVKFFKSGDKDEMAASMIELAHDAGLRNRLIRNGRDYVAHNNWSVKKQDYLGLVDRLVAPAPARSVS